MLSRTTMPSPPFDQSTWWNTRGMVRASRLRPSTRSGSMSTVAQPICTSPAANVLRMSIGLSRRTSSILKSCPLASFQTFLAFMPSLA